MRPSKILILSLITYIFFGVFVTYKKIDNTKEVLANPKTNLILPVPFLKPFNENTAKAEIISKPKESQITSQLDNYTYRKESEKLVNKTIEDVHSAYSLIGVGCDENILPSDCKLSKNSVEILTLKNCQENEADGCNLYKYKLGKQDEKEIYILQEYAEGQTLLLEILTYNISSNQDKLVGSFIYDKAIPESIIDYNEALRNYSK
jgi:hypothetical protein